MCPAHRRSAAQERLREALPGRTPGGRIILPSISEPAVPDPELRRALAAVRRVFGPSAEVMATDAHQSFSLHHVGLAMPRGAAATAKARAFYGGLLGLTELAVPASAGRGEVWFGAGGLELHLRAENGFRPARAAHPGILAGDVDALAARLQGHGVTVRLDHGLPGYQRLAVQDPFGNRLEFLATAHEEGRDEEEEGGGQAADADRPRT